MASLVLFIIFIIVLGLAVSGGLGMHIAVEKGREWYIGFLVGLVPLFGHLLLALMPATDLHVVEEMYSRNLMNVEDYNKTREVLIKELKSK